MKNVNRLGIDVAGKRECGAVAIKDDKGTRNLLYRIHSHGKCVAVLEVFLMALIMQEI
jgi:hypothetical protein